MRDVKHNVWVQNNCHMRMYYVDWVERGGVSVEVLDLCNQVGNGKSHSCIHGVMRPPSLLLLFKTIVLNA